MYYICFSYRAGFTCLQDYYDWVSSAKCMQNVSDIKLLYGKEISRDPIG